MGKNRKRRAKNISPKVENKTEDKVVENIDNEEVTALAEGEEAVSSEEESVKADSLEEAASEADASKQAEAEADSADARDFEDNDNGHDSEAGSDDMEAAAGEEATPDEVAGDAEAEASEDGNDGYEADEDSKEGYRESSDESDRDSEAYRRAIRHQRRVRVQIAAYLILFVMAGLLIAGAGFLVKTVGERIKEAGVFAAETVQEEEVSPEEDKVIMSPVEDIEDESSPVADVPVSEELQNVIDNMTLEEEIAGLFIITPEQLTATDNAVKAGDKTREALEQTPVGGLVYSSNNIIDSVQITDMLSETSKICKYPLFFAVSEAGGASGVVAPALGLEETALPSEYASDDDAAAGASAIASYLTTYGFNLNLAPSAILSERPEAFGIDPQEVSGRLSSYVISLEQSGVSACVGSFPSEADKVSETVTGCNLSKEDLESRFGPFYSAIDAGADMIMMGNVICPALTGDGQTPCSLSEGAISDTLRTSMGYKGIVITDALNMPCITSQYTADAAAVAAINAGADMIYLPEDFDLAYNGLLEAVQNGSVSKDRIDLSMKRILSVKFGENDK
ncbi:glycoside hydrolase family 3 N-terminal domain-containing protein [Butyrivibrio sp. MC2013]|uniref:glycoside hydrolase family 3 N-terminal domain-containing protein n=1 Tax=Butyrivibrio sp. MC2013 TaxID=1280686 RepID=UPI000411F933|nr:glycoside hydrolase family 3 N-terminal domain-containing protein [Butyrivibrio sp. MC2013]